MTQAPPPICIITRPMAAGQAFCAQLQDVRLSCILSPLLQIRSVDVSIQNDSYKSVILTSAHAACRLVALDVPKSRVVYCVGEKTALAARDAGYSAVAGPGDADGLVDWIPAQSPVGPILHLRGAHSRGDVAKRLTDTGLKTEEIVVYEQLACDLSTEAHQALEGDQLCILPLFSPRTAVILGEESRPKAPIHVVAMSHAVADACSWAAPASITIADAPTADAMVHAIGNIALQHRMP